MEEIFKVITSKNISILMTGIKPQKQDFQTALKQDKYQTFHSYAYHIKLQKIKNKEKYWKNPDGSGEGDNLSVENPE